MPSTTRSDVSGHYRFDILCRLLVSLSPSRTLTCTWRWSSTIFTKSKIATVCAAFVLAIAPIFLPAASASASTEAPERLNATAYYGKVNVLAREVTDPKAKFMKVDGTPVHGLPVKFTVTGEKSFLCDATTDTNGYAECRNAPIPLVIPLVQLLLSGYDATFDGNAWYTPVNAHNSVGLQ